MSDDEKHPPKTEAALRHFFDEDDLEPLNPSWSEDDMLEQDGMFHLKDVAGKLNLTTAELKKRAADLEKEGFSSWEVMGIRKIWAVWVVRMKHFATYFEDTPFSRVKAVDEDWDANDMLAQKGQFYLADVCDKIPFTQHQIRYQARRCEDSKQKYGVWKDPEQKTYIVDMEIFARWIRGIWKAV